MKSSDIILPLLSLVIIILILLFIGFLLITSNFNTSNTEGTTKKGKQVVGTGITCKVGECATNLMSGFKRCPSSNQTINTEPGEICNSQFSCDNPITPYALQSDGSTNYLGQCEPGVACSCLRQPQCSAATVSIFNLSSGNILQQIPGQRLILNQKSNFVNNGETLQDTSPISYQNPAASFCAIPKQFLTSIGCNFDIIDCETLKICFGLASGCNGVKTNPCQQGTLAILTDDSTSWTLKDLDTSQFACVSGQPCGCDQFPLYDTNLGSIICKNIIC